LKQSSLVKRLAESGEQIGVSGICLVDILREGLAENKIARVAAIPVSSNVA
jgi:hypothetical protein